MASSTRRVNSMIVMDSTVSTTPVTGAMRVVGGLGVAGSVNVGGNIATTGNISATGNITATGNLSIAGTGDFTNTTNSTNTSTGAVTIAGGLGVGLAINGAATAGDIIKGDGTSMIRLARGTAGQVLTATATDIEWGPAGGLTENTAQTTNATPVTIQTIGVSDSSSVLLNIKAVAIESVDLSSNNAGSFFLKTGYARETALGQVCCDDLLDFLGSGWTQTDDTNGVPTNFYIRTTASGTNVLVQVIGNAGDTIQWKVATFQQIMTHA